MTFNMDSSLKDTNLFLLKRSRDLLRRNAEYKEVESSAKKTYLSLNDAANVGDNDVCIVTNDLPPTDQRAFVQYLAARVRKDSSKVYVYAGYRFNYTKDGAITPVQKITRFDRRPFVARYRNNDNKEELVDVFTGETFACSGRVLNDILGIKQSGTSNEVISVACAELDIPIVCILPKRDWSGQPSRKSSNEVIAVFDTDEHATVFSYKGWGREKKLEALSISTEVKTEGPSDPESVAVIITTHNRTETAKTTIESLVKRLKYPKLHWFIADDRSEPGHVQQLVDKFSELGVNDVHVTETNEEHWGLGASLNNALTAAFKLTDIVLTTEDDWYLQYDFDISEYVDVLKNAADVGMIRLGAANNMRDVLALSDLPGFLYLDQKLYAKRPRKVKGIGLLLNNQVALRKKSVYTTLGLYNENVTPDVVEMSMNNRYLSNPRFKILWPASFDTSSLVCDGNPFVHFGESTLGHNFKEATDKAIRIMQNINTADTGHAEYDSTGCSSHQKPFFRVIVPVYMSVNSLKRALKSIAGQTFTDYVVAVCDDGSPEDIRNINRKTVEDTLGQKGIFVFHETTKFAGAARNTAIHAAPDSEYTLFLDADDNYVAPTVFKDLHDHIVKNSYPDAIPLSFVSSGRSHLKDTLLANSPEALSVRCTAPWRKCIKTSKLRDFNEGLRRANDVVQHLRQVDCIDTVVPFTKDCVSYNTDGDTTNFGKNKKKNSVSKDSIRALFRVCADILDETYKHDYMRKAVKKQINLIATQLIPEALRSAGDRLGDIVEISE
jgi:glycosyltransferase involved in cell wall biosynthesis